MLDKNGKTISIGSTVRLPNGTTTKVSGILSTGAHVTKSSDVEVVHAEHSKAADGDSIIWGS